MTLSWSKISILLTAGLLALLNAGSGSGAWACCESGWGATTTDGVLSEINHEFKSLANGINARSQANTRLIEAAKAGDLPQVQKLVVNEEANVNVQDVIGQTPVKLAAEFGRTAVADFLASHGADLNTTASSDQMTPLMDAILFQHFDTARALIADRADVNAKTPHDYEFGNTALMLASNTGYADMVRALLAAGADVNHKDAFGNTALSLAKLYGHDDVVQLLKAHDAR